MTRELLPFYVIHYIYTPTYHTHPFNERKEHHFQMNRPATNLGLTVANLSLLKRSGDTVFVSAPSTTSHKTGSGAEEGGG